MGPRAPLACCQDKGKISVGSAHLGEDAGSLPALVLTSPDQLWAH